MEVLLRRPSSLTAEQRQAWRRGRSSYGTRRGVGWRAMSLAALLALPREARWEQADRQGCDDLSLSIARALLERQTKLKAVLSSDGGGHRRKLKAWPG